MMLLTIAGDIVWQTPPHKQSLANRICRRFLTTDELVLAAVALQAVVGDVQLWVAPAIMSGTCAFGRAHGQRIVKHLDLSYILQSLMSAFLQTGG